MLQTEHEFTLPLGYLDKEGRLHKSGIIRLATAADEILPQRDERVRSNPAYLTVIVLSRVIVRLGEVQHINTATVERLFAADLEYLQDLYNTINQVAVDSLSLPCPRCAEKVEVAREPQGESWAIPSGS
jgi:PHP family Zn ribbon phosphoesterase